jgi:hypothetical protein
MAEKSFFINTETFQVLTSAVFYSNEDQAQE